MKNFNDFNYLNSINESLNMWYDVILNSVDAEEVNIYETFNLPKDGFSTKLDLEYLSENNEFINSLLSIGLKKSTVENTDDYSTFISKSCRFMFIYRVESNELENPVFILFQTWDNADIWDSCKAYRINSDIKKFYDKLSSKVIELDLDGKKWIYSTSNGTEWVLQNVDKATSDFKKYLRKEDLELLIKTFNIKLNII